MATAWWWPHPALAFFIFFLHFSLPCLFLGDARQRVCDAVAPRTAVNPFSLPCVTYCARQRAMPCVAFS
jgi:hypothetical protein